MYIVHLFTAQTSVQIKRADNMVDYFYRLFYVPSNPANETNAKCQ